MVVPARCAGASSTQAPYAPRRGADRLAGKRYVGTFTQSQSPAPTHSLSLAIPHQSVCVSASLPVCLRGCLSVPPSLYLYLCVSCLVCLCVRARAPVCLFTCLVDCLPVCLVGWPFGCVCVCVLYVAYSFVCLFGRACSFVSVRLCLLAGVRMYSCMYACMHAWMYVCECVNVCMSCHVMSCHVMSCHARPSHATPRHVMSRLVT